MNQVISELPDCYFNNWLADFLYNKTKMKRLETVLFQKTRKSNDENLSFVDLILEGEFFIKHSLTSLPKPIYPEFHKGYRDHGSLGSEISRIAKEERDDMFLRLAEEERQRRHEESLQFLLGFIE